MAGIVAGLCLDSVCSIWFPAATLVLLSLVLIWKQKRACLLPVLLFFTIGYWNVQSWAQPNLPANHISCFIDDKPWHIIGTLDSHAEQFPDRTRFKLQVESISRDGDSYKARGALRVTVLEKVPALYIGDRVACLARLKSIQNFNNPGRFDYRRHLAFRQIWAAAYVPGEKFIIRLTSDPEFRFDRAVGLVRTAVSSLIDETTSRNRADQDAAAGVETQRSDNKQVGGILKALVTGDRSEITKETREVFNKIGIGHLLAISGLHIGMVATLAFLCLRFILSRSKKILLAAWPAKGAAILSLLPILFYGLLAGMSPATLRAVIMVVVFLLAMVLEKQQDNVNTLAIAALVILIITPWALFEASFQLSFAAVFAIVYILEHVPPANRLASGPKKPYKRLVLFLLVSAAAILGTLPLTLYHFNQISLIGILTNCILVPLVGFMVVPLGLLSVLLLPIGATVSMFVMKTAAVIMELGLSLAVSFSKWPFASIKTVTPTLIEIAIYYALAWTLINFRRTTRARPLLIALALAGLVDAAYWINDRYGRSELTVTAIDVRQGSSTLVELPGGSCMLVDGGGFYDNRFNVGDLVVAPFLWRRRIAAVDTLVLSHPHPDHLNGLLSIAKDFNVKEVWMNMEQADTEQYNAFLKIISKKGIRVRGPGDLAAPQTISGVQFQVLYPPVDFLEDKAAKAWRTANNNSLVMKISFNYVSFLLPGDIESEAETELASLACSTLKTNVLFSPHHGSKNSSTPAFLKCVQPKIAVISSGWKNIFRFPHQNTLDRYRANAYRIFRTDRFGAISITTDGARLSVSPFIASRS